MNTPTTGHCQCGHIQYRLSGEPLMVYVCHCQDCQKQSASAFGLSMWVNATELHFDGAEPSIFKTRGGSGKAKLCAFCGRCGTRIYHGSDDPEAPLSVKAGTLSDTSCIRPIAHIWTSSAQPWLRIDDAEMLCFETEPDREALMQRWKQRQA